MDYYIKKREGSLGSFDVHKLPWETTPFRYRGSEVTNRKELPKGKEEDYFVECWWIIKGTEVTTGFRNSLVSVSSGS